MKSSSLVGIVVVTFNAAEAADIALRSVFAAKNGVAYRLIVVDNASENQGRSAIRALVEAASRDDGIDCHYVQNDENLGFSGGNNVGIKLLLEDPEISDICLLNSDVIVTDGWLDRLIAYDMAAISAVTNRADSEQWVPEDYPIELAQVVAKGEEGFQSALRHVETQAAKRLSAFRGNIVECDVTFFCVILKREVVEQVGLLDETFFPGGFEDDDYCLRLRQGGYPIGLARDVYIHHFGSASFGKLDYSYFAGRAKENLRYLEAKHGITWRRRPEKPLVSFLMDFRHALQAGELFTASQIELLVAHLDQVDKMVRHIGSEFSNLRAEFVLSGKSSHKALRAISRADDAVDIVGVWENLVSDLRVALESGRTDGFENHELMRLGQEVCEAIKAVADANFEINATLRGANPGVVSPEVSGWGASEWHARRGLSRSIWAGWKALQLLIKFNGVVFFGGYFYPEREKDGYFQRIRAVDGLVSDGWRIYVENDGLQGRQALLDRPEERVLVIRILGGRIKRAFLKAATWALALRSRKVYFHSVLSMGNGFHRLMRFPFMRSTVDMHGVVPEEFRLHDDYYNAVVYERKEQYFYQHAKRVVVVSEAMRRYLSAKYRDFKMPHFINFPIFPVVGEYRGPREGRGAGDSPVAVYAGGLHKWQQPEKTLLAMDASYPGIKSHFLTPDPATAEEMASRIGCANMPTFGSMNHQDLLRFYRRCDFGYILREDNVVNNVACPTKVVEYLANGVVPIVDSENFGDFKALGMRSLILNDFLQGVVPGPVERSEIAKANFRVYHKLRKARDRGARELADYLAVRANTDVSVSGAASSRPVDVLVQVGNFEAGGLENVVLELNEYLIEQGFRIVLLVLGTQGWAASRARELGQQVIGASYERESHRRLLEDLKPKIVLTHYSTQGLDVCRDMGIPTIQVIHNIYMWLAGEELSAFRDAAGLTSRFVAVSAAVRNYSVAKLGISGERCDVVENGIDLRKFPVEDRLGVREKLRNRLGIGVNEFVFLDMAAINHQKNHRDVVLAFAQASQGCDNARLVVLGPCYEPTLLQELKRLVHSAGLENRVTLIERTEAPWDFYALADAFVSATLFEGGPLTLLEALASNLPVVFPRVGVATNFEGRRGVHLIDTAVDIAHYEGDIGSLRSNPEFVSRLARAMMDLWCNPAKPDLTADDRELLNKELCFSKYVDIILAQQAVDAPIHSTFTESV